MPNRPRAGITLLIAVVVFLAPVLASAYLAWWESYSTEKTLGLAYAQEVLRRMEVISSQLTEGERELARADVTPCSAQDIKLLQAIDLGASAMKAAGRLKDNELLCTSQGTTNPIPLVMPDLVTPQGVSLYFNRNLGEQQHPLNIFAIHEFAMIFDPRVAVDISTDGPEVELGVFIPFSANHFSVAVQGKQFPSKWFDPMIPGTQSTTLNSGYLVSRISSPNDDFAVVAATPQRYIDQRIGSFAIIFIPVGMLCGAIFSLMVSLLSRVHSSFPTMLRHAISDGSLYVVYQPVVELATRRVAGAEALVRWRSRLADMRPDYFIPEAEKHDLIQLITRQLLTMVARDLPHFLKTDPNFWVAVNFSAADLSDIHTLEVMDEFLRVSGARPHNIEIEATERAFLQAPETAELIDALRAKGFSVAIDDFGTGYSSLACLQSLSLDTLKIDRAFVDTINTDGATSQVVLHIIDMAHSLNLEMVAEGVENEPQAQYLMRRGVQYAQGWHFGRPMDPGPLCEQIRIHATAGPEGVGIRSVR